MTPDPSYIAELARVMRAEGIKRLVVDESGRCEITIDSAPPAPPVEADGFATMPPPPAEEGDDLEPLTPEQQAAAEKAAYEKYMATLLASAGGN